MREDLLLCKCSSLNQNTESSNLSCKIAIMINITTDKTSPMAFRIHKTL